ncbi:DUF397 domain-containing protein [Streptomyces sp. CA-132043]|uniref:DUF397 domain-containing protein n=1 Tax=Streptomyces sp. CA-132043 TaxID=3240048 RepID=UPI003D8B614F
MASDRTRGLVWRKSSRSGSPQGWDSSCVEIALGPAGVVHVRDSKDTSRPGFVVGPGAWEFFVGGLKR